MHKLENCKNPCNVCCRSSPFTAKIWDNFCKLNLFFRNPSKNQPSQISSWRRQQPAYSLIFSSLQKQTYACLCGSKSFIIISSPNKRKRRAQEVLRLVIRSYLCTTNFTNSKNKFSVFQLNSRTFLRIERFKSTKRELSI